MELITAATESVTANASSTADISDTLSGENLAEVFGIEIQPLETAPKSKPLNPRSRKHATLKPKKTPISATFPVKTSRDKKRLMPQQKKKAKASGKKIRGSPATRSQTKSVRQNRGALIEALGDSMGSIASGKRDHARNKKHLRDYGR